MKEAIGDGTKTVSSMRRNEARLSRLTRREREVLSLLVEGYTNKEIAQRINREEITIKTHLKSIYRKLNISNRVQAVRVVFELTWVANTTWKLTDALKLVIWQGDNEHPNKP